MQMIEMLYDEIKDAVDRNVPFITNWICKKIGSTFSVL